jgi:hypothetical protein
MKPRYFQRIHAAEMQDNPGTPGSVKPPHHVNRHIGQILKRPALIVLGQHPPLTDGDYKPNH